MHVFITGAAGYIGGSVAAALVARGDRVTGLARRPEQGPALAAQGIEAVIGDLSQAGVLTEAAREADVVINAAEANHPEAVQTLLKALAGTDKCLVQTSGSGIVGDLAGGERGERIYDEETPFTPSEKMATRHAIDVQVRAAASIGIRSVVIRPSLIYGRGTGLQKESFQVPVLIKQARENRVARHPGRGENIWSHVHITDIVDLYLRAIDRAPAGSLFYGENGEAAMRTTVGWISTMLGLGGATEAWAMEAAVAYWGPRTHISLASNSRVRGRLSREVLGWAPGGPTLEHEILRGHYAGG